MDEDKKKDSQELADEETRNENKKKEEIDDEDLFSDEEEFEEDGDTWERARVWIQDNLRVILSVLIVVLIAVGIYNYSRKPVGEESKVDQMIGEQEVAFNEQQANANNNIEVKEQTEKKDQVVVKDENVGGTKEAETQTPAGQKQPTTPSTVAEKTIEGYTVTAGKGDGLTHLARKALQEFLAANPDAALTKEHKIYIEDYLRRQIAQGRIHPGDTRVFSESLVKDAIGKSKTLNERQLQNLKKYSARVANL
jgi:hypothetical protein